jgi:hypothetical protein
MTTWALSPNSILPPPSSHCTFIPPRKNSEPVEKMFLFHSTDLQNIAHPKLRKTCACVFLLNSVSAKLRKPVRVYTEQCLHYLLRLQVHFMHIIEEYILGWQRWASDVVAQQNKHIKACTYCCCRYDLFVRCLTTLQTSVTKSNIRFSVALSYSSSLLLLQCVWVNC